jgi:predicted RNA-binding protein associated with RNAse of E/G family
MTEITIIKRSHHGTVALEYRGEVVERGETWVCVRARFNFADKPVGPIVFRRGDLFTEWHYADRWYNVFEIHDVDDNHLKGWYCNVTRPALIDDGTVQADDLALDMFVSPDGGVLVLDEDEFSALDLPDTDRQQALMTVQVIREIVERREPPFDSIIETEG